MLELLFVLVGGFLLDLLLGDPPYPYHPVRIMGGAIRLITRWFESLGLRGKVWGLGMAFIVLAVTLVGYILIRGSLSSLHPIAGLFLDLFLCYSCLALKDLVVHVNRVIRSLDRGDLAQARNHIAMVVGRDTSVLDSWGVGRAAVETLAENFVDGFLSPLFWYVVGGFFGILMDLSPVTGAICTMLAFKLASTLDSMVGYKDERFREFGWAGARWDDLMNFVPARLSVGILFLGAWTSGLDAMNGLRIAMRDRLRHDSPNSAHAESFVAGALNISLGGPTLYSTGVKNKPWLGDGSPHVEPGTVAKATRLVTRSAWTVMILSGLMMMGMI